ncbi:MAG: hypothetical protein CMJ18_06320 [Phycisphaeraceae bacterium]|nr:hypothetical protein [Phycisphaeraceae bacterium]
MTTQPRPCPKCRNPLPSAGGPCPACLLAAVASGDDSISFIDDGIEGRAAAELEVALPEYRDLQLLGEGGMGAVYRAQHSRLSRSVAIKVLKPHTAASPGFHERFQREARALARLDHPNIVKVFDFGHVGAFPYIVMEYVEGANLRVLLKSGALGAEDVLEIIPQLCDALSYAHSKGVVHRDIKPDNILIDDEGRVRIADFGLAKLANEDLPTPPLTRTDQVMGTPHYMAPEQVEHPTEVDHRADIFSLGVVFYEMLTGELPLGSFDPPSRRRNGDARLDPVVLRALEKDPDLRYQQAREVNQDLEDLDTANDRFYSKNPVDPLDDPLLQPVRSSDAWVVVVVILGIFLLLAMLAAWMVMRGGDTPTDPQVAWATSESDPGSGPTDMTPPNIALLQAAGSGDLDRVKRAIADGASVNYVHSHREQRPRGPVSSHPIGRAAEEGHLAIVSYLLDQGANPDLSTQTSSARAVHHAAAFGHDEIVKLLAKFQANLEVTNDDGDTPLLLAWKHGHFDVISVLAAAGQAGRDIAVDQRNGLDHTVMGLAADAGKVEVVVDLAAAGADPLERNQFLVTALNIAAEQLDSRILVAMLARLETLKDGSPLMAAIRYHRPDNVRLILAKGCPVNQAPSGTTPLMMAMFGGGIEIVKLLLEHGADPSIKHPDGETARDLAVKHGHKAIVKLLDDHK